MYNSNMSDRSLIQSLVVAESLVDVFLNVQKKPLMVYRADKFFHRPFRYALLLAAKAGVIKSAQTRTFFGSSFAVPLSDVNGAALYYAGCLRDAESYVTRFLVNELKNNSVFYDVGANYGFYSALALSRGAIVHAFDPSEHCMQFLKRNTGASNERTTLNQVALSDAEGTVDFFDTSFGYKSGMSTISEVIARSNSMAYQKSVVPAMKLDTYVQNHDIPTIIKIDVEGAEAKVLNGARETLRSHAPTLVVEIWGSSVSRANSYATLALLDELGYRSHMIASDGSVYPVEVNLDEIGENNNFVFMKP